MSGDVTVKDGYDVAVKVTRSASIDEMIKWLDETTLQATYSVFPSARFITHLGMADEVWKTHIIVIFTFFHPNDAMHFKLRWVS